MTHRTQTPLNDKATASSLSGPLFSIITVVRNNVGGIEKTITSVRRQSYRPIQYIIIDGGSTDGTVDIIRNNEDVISIWRSEPDRNVYDAMNKGLALAHGDWIMFLNSDDTFYRNTVARYARILDCRALDYLYGATHRLDATGNRFVDRPVDSEQIAQRAFSEMPVPHTSLCINARVYRQIGGFDTRYQIAGDQEHFLRMCQAGFAGADSKVVVGTTMAGGLSDNYRVTFEFYQTALRYGQPQAQALFWFYNRLLKHLARRLIGPKLAARIAQWKGSRHYG
jgi:glycosyltransferase involved in cell wall biosynthesis